LFVPITNLGPIVTLDTPNSITTNSVNLTLTISLSVLASACDYYGFDIGPGYHNYSDDIRSASGSYGPGQYWINVSNPSWVAGQIIHVRAKAHNLVGLAYSPNEIAIVLPAGTAPPGEPPVVITPPTGGVDFVTQLKLWMASWGMDNATGHWAFMFVLLAIVLVVFGFFMVFAKERFVRITLAGLSALAAGAIIGTFLFSRLLGTVTLIAFIFTCVGLVIVIGGNLLERGRVRGAS
jgi:hypothetical protein